MWFKGHGLGILINFHYLMFVTLIMTQGPRQGRSHGGLGGTGPPFGKKVQQNRPFYTPNFEDILLFCIYLTLFNIIVPKNF